MEENVNDKMVEILLVEDNPNDAMLTKRSLDKQNLANNLIWLEDGEQALDFLFTRGKFADRNPDIQPRLILLDLKMPKINGLEVLKAIRSDERTREIPTVVMTSSREEPDLKKAYALGTNSYIVKPVDFEKFSKCISEVGYYWMIINSTALDGIRND